MDFKLGFGPMSREVITSICQYTAATGNPLMLISSRNQIDADSGYVMTTPEYRQLLSTLPTQNVWVCRDHCGPYFLDAEKSLALRDAVEATKKTIAYDIEQGYDLIRIDKYRHDVAFAKDMTNIEFVVAQTGSLCHEDHQHGEFNYQAAVELVGIANSGGVKLKEHNADYLTAMEILLRRDAGVHALNIAPQLGVVQTKLLRTLSSKYAVDEWNAFANVVLATNRWRKWTDLDNNTQRVNVAGHYAFATPEYRAVVDKLTAAGIDWQHAVDQVIFEILHTYVTNL